VIDLLIVESGSVSNRRLDAMLYSSPWLQI